MELQQVKAEATALSIWAHIATVGADGKPDVVPIHPCWEGDTLWFMTGKDSVKVRNLADNPNVALHWQVSEKGDGVELWGTAQFHDDLETKRRLWNGVFDYELNDFAPGGPEDSAHAGFVGITPERAIFVRQYGVAGIERWKAS